MIPYRKTSIGRFIIVGGTMPVMLLKLKSLPRQRRHN
jgi:tRNA G37 N-methylase TrmD